MVSTLGFRLLDGGDSPVASPAGMSSPELRYVAGCRAGRITIAARRRTAAPRVEQVSGPVLLLELNELCPPLLERFIEAGDLPAFARLRAESVVCTTDAGEPQEHLNPWIQWVTAHTGVGFADHHVFKLGEGASLTHPTVADVVSAAGHPVWLCGPMNVVPTTVIRGRWLPDPWNPDPDSVDPELRPFADFVRANVQEHTNAAHRLGSRELLRFLHFMVRHGLSASTVGAAAAQLAGERVGRRQPWRRAALLDRFQWDLFEHEHRRLHPRFATYFSNTTAHYQHIYWRYMEPDAFTLQPSPDEVEQLGGAVRFGYQQMDRIVDRALALAGATTTLVLCTALSQQPYLLGDEQGGNRFYRPRDIASFVTRLGIGPVDRVAPVMAAQFHLLFADEPGARAAAATLESATVAGVPAFDVRRVGSDVFTGFAVTEDLPGDAEVEVPSTGVRLPVAEWLYRAETPKSGYHHPEGAFWVRRPGGQPGDGGTIPLRAVASTLVRLAGVEPPASMSPPVAALVGAA